MMTNQASSYSNAAIAQYAHRVLDHHATAHVIAHQVRTPTGTLLPADQIEATLNQEVDVRAILDAVGINLSSRGDRLTTPDLTVQVTGSTELDNVSTKAQALIEPFQGITRRNHSIAMIIGAYFLHYLMPATEQDLAELHTTRFEMSFLRRQVDLGQSVEDYTKSLQQVRVFADTLLVPGYLIERAIARVSPRHPKDSNKIPQINEADIFTELSRSLNVADESIRRRIQAHLRG